MFLDIFRFQPINILKSSSPTKEGPEGHAPPPPLLFFKLDFSRDVFLETRFCVILQGIQNYFDLGNSRISSGAL